MSLLRPELCIGTKQSTGKSHFKTSPSPACLGEAELPGAAQMRVRQGGQEAAACNLHRGGMLSAAVLDKRRAAVPSLLAWDRRSVLRDFELATQTWGGESPPVVLSSYCCCILGRSSALFYGRNMLSLNQTWVRVFIKAARGASVIPGAGHPAAMCPVGELLSPPQSEAGTGASGGSAVPGFCLLKRRKYKETYPWRFIPIKTLFPANRARTVDIHSKECCSSQKLYLWWILLLLSWQCLCLSHQKTIQLFSQARQSVKKAFTQCAACLWNTLMHGSTCVQIHLKYFREKGIFRATENRWQGSQKAVHCTDLPQDNSNSTENSLCRGCS